MGKCSVKGLALLLADFFLSIVRRSLEFLAVNFFFLLRTLK